MTTSNPISRSCVRCQGSFPVKSRRSQRSVCDPCKKNRDRESAQKRNRLCRLSLYGLSTDDYSRMVAEQHGVCAICHRPETFTGSVGTPVNLSVDHNHSTGTVRGLLCRACNIGIIKELDDRIKVIGIPQTIRAINYVLAEYGYKVTAQD